MPSNRNANRREFLKNVAGVGAGFWIANHYARGEEGTSKDDKLNVAVVGVSNRGGENIKDLVATNLVNFVALCDIDDKNLEGALKQFPKAKTYNDYRKMLEQKDIDAVLVATADHVHAWATLAALRAGKDVYCEKPLTHSIEETRLVTQTAARENRVTQMGTQIHAGDNYRRVVELIQGGAIGPVSEVHIFITSAWFQKEPARMGVEPPSNLHWDLWLGPTPDRPYSPDYLPFVWRRWWSFGEGTLGDMGCHFIDLPKWALKLGDPVRVRAEGPPVHPEWCPEYLNVEYDFPARGDLPPVKLTWHDAGRRPEIAKELHLDKWKNGILFVGEKGYLISDYGNHKLLPEDKFKDFQPPQESIPKSLGHHKEWILACMKHEPKTPLCNFSYAGPLTETVLLGTVAFRTGRAIEWDAKQLRATNAPDADQFLRLRYRKGWSLQATA
jgi:predicted dehydrogenase